VPLTDVRVRALKPEAKPRKYADGGGLYVLVTPAGGKLWRWKYRYGGRERGLAFGSYPNVSLAKARQLRDEARVALADGRDPAADRRAEKAAAKRAAVDTFESVARGWLAKMAGEWSPAHARKVEQRLERHVLPRLGSLPVSDVAPSAVLEMAETIVAKGAVETAHRAVWDVGQIMRRAIVMQLATTDPTVGVTAELRRPPATKHFDAVVDPKELGGLLRAFDAYQGSQAVRCAIRLQPHVFVRPGELRAAEWSEIDFDAALWTIPAARTKSKREHLVPLSRQSLEILEEMRRISAHRSRLVFPRARSAKRPLSDAAMTGAYRRMEIERLTAHGFRATARTLLREELGFDSEIIEHQLAHAVRDPLGRAYNRTHWLEERTKMLQTWSDYLDSLQSASPSTADDSSGGSS